ncbi:hypothetical protein [Klebsiella pneumoniae IS39]|nr:hypothetical protein [Klebsiella pneumoniae IS39]
MSPMKGQKRYLDENIKFYFCCECIRTLADYFSMIRIC